MIPRLRTKTYFEGPNGEPSSEGLAAYVHTRVYDSDGKEVSCVTQTGQDWRAEKRLWEREGKNDETR